MCYYTSNTKSVDALKRRYKKSGNIILSEYTPQLEFNGFEFPMMPIIIENGDDILLSHWGLWPAWANDDFNKMHTLNARWETLSEKPSFQTVVQQKCLVPAEAFFEWKWLNKAGSKKEKFRIEVVSQEIFSLAGLWTEKRLGDLMYHSFTIITIDANPLMAEINNQKKRMPLIISQENEAAWLENKLDLSKNNVVLNPISLDQQLSLF